ncbi:MAG: DUF3618 domain-containing protein [Prosthecobacter sp.]|nr:DUF3618 domain-containing protein [Prosthecobacter sp.]
MIKPLLILLGVVTAMLVTAYLTCGDFGFRMIAFVSAVWIGGPLLLLTTLVGFYRTKEHGWHAWRPAGWILAAMLVSIATQKISKQVLYWEEERAKNYPAQVEAELEQFRQSKGRYPNTLEELAPKASPPRLIRYSLDQGEYAFSTGSYGFFDGADYDRKTKSWTSRD